MCLCELRTGFHIPEDGILHSHYHKTSDFNNSCLNSHFSRFVLAETRQPLSRRLVSSGMLRRVTVVRTDGSEELSASFIRVRRIGEPGTTLTVTNNRRTTASVVPGSPFLSP
jgi:hypothetical protein